VRSKYSESHAFITYSIRFPAFMNRQHKASSTEHAVILDKRKCYVHSSLPAPVVSVAICHRTSFPETNQKAKWYHLPKTPYLSQYTLLPRFSTSRLLLILRLPALRILWLLLSTIRPALRRPSLHRNLLPSCSSSRLHHILHVRPVLEVLVEFANVAADVLVGLEAEGYDGDEAEAGWSCVLVLCRRL
jgi:hypothetical protein